MINFFIQLKSICGVRREGSVSVPLKIAAGFTSLTDKSEIVIHWLENWHSKPAIKLLWGAIEKKKKQAKTTQALAAPPSSKEIKKPYVSSSHCSPDHKGIPSCSF